MDFVREKWKKAFRVFFDADKSGSVDWNDLEQIISRVKNLRGDSGAEPAKVQLTEVWQNLQSLADADKSGDVSVEEFVQLVGNPNNQWLTGLKEFFFTLLDPSGDKQIDEGEYVEVLSLFDQSPAAAKESYGKLIAGSGKSTIDAGLFETLWNQYFTSADSLVPGNNLFG